MVKEEEIRELYTKGWTNPYDAPDWMHAFHWNHQLWEPVDGEPLEATLQRYCAGFLTREPDNVILGPDGSVYMERYRIAEAREGGVDGEKIYLNHFLRGDLDEELHSHPWDSSRSLVLLNGYGEERRHTKTLTVPGLIQCRHSVVRYQRMPGDVIEINNDTFHRIDDLPHGCAWTLFFTGRYVGTWYFWNRTTGRTEQWRSFLQSRGRLN